MATSAIASAALISATLNQRASSSSCRSTTISCVADAAFTGNPAAVCLLDSPAEPEWMQSVAAEIEVRPAQIYAAPEPTPAPKAPKTPNCRSPIRSSTKWLAPWSMPR